MSTKKLRSDRKDDYYNFPLREARLMKGYTQHQLAQLVGLSGFNLIGSYERLRAVPSEEVSQIIANVLDVPKEKLFPDCLSAIVRDVQLERQGVENQNSHYGNIHTLPESHHPATPPLLDEILHSDTSEKVQSCLDLLTFREREIIKMRFGIGNTHTYTYEECARQFQVTRERVRQIEAKAVRKLAQPLRRLNEFLALR